MRQLFICAVSILIPATLWSQEAESTESVAQKEVKVFSVDSVIHPSLKGLPALLPHEGVGTVSLPIMSQSDEAVRFVRKGVALLNAAWDFEAYRYFCAAAEADPDCMMAYWGICMTVGSGLPEFSDQWTAASARMRTLLAARTEDGTEFMFPKYERQHASCASLLLSDGPVVAAAGYTEMARLYPNDLQSKLLASLLSIGGYDDFDKVTESQKKAEGMISKALKDHPDSVSAMMTYLLVHSTVPNGDPRWASDILPLANQMVKASDGFGTHNQILSFYEWKTGNLIKSEQAAKEAEDFYASYMKEQKVGIEDCEKWILSRVFRIFLMNSRGASSEAIALAKDLTKLTVKKERIESVGARVFLWDARSLLAKLYIDRGQKGDMQLAMDSLPKPKSQNVYSKESQSVMYLQAVALTTRLSGALGQKKFTLATNIQKTMDALVVKLIEGKDLAISRGAISDWHRAAYDIQATAYRMRAEIALAKGEKSYGRAKIWYTDTVDSEKTPSLFRVPATLRSSYTDLAKISLLQGQAEGAVSYLEKSLASHPSDLRALKLYSKSLTATGKKAEAALIDVQIKMLSAL